MITFDIKNSKLFGIPFLFFGLPVLLIAQPNINEYNKYLTLNNQVVFVTATNYNAAHGKMQLYHRRNSDRKWKLKAEFEVTLGRNGLAFDRKSILNKPAFAVVKQEGDGRSPAGIFALGPVFSYHTIQDLHMPFKKVDTTDICVDDIKSAFYNRLVNTDTLQHKDWNSFEYMRRKDSLYEYGVWVKYNTDTIFAGNGSCIFLHVWGGINSATSGCTAMQKENMLLLIHWLNSKYHPVLLQLVLQKK